MSWLLKSYDFTSQHVSNVSNWIKTRKLVKSVKLGQTCANSVKSNRFYEFEKNIKVCILVICTLTFLLFWIYILQNLCNLIIKSLILTIIIIIFLTKQVICGFYFRKIRIPIHSSHFFLCKLLTYQLIYYSVLAGKYIE